MHHLARVRWIVARYPWIYWTAVGLAAVLIGMQVHVAMHRVDAARRSWGTTTDLWVAAGEIEPGATIAAQRRALPQAMMPANVTLQDPTGSTARQHLAAGEIITTFDVSANGAAGLVPEGWVALAVPAPVTHFSVGDDVAVFDAGQRIAAGIIVEVGESDAMVAVSEEDAAALAAATLSDTVALALASRAP